MCWYHFTDLKDRSGFGQKSVFNINLLTPTFLDTQFFSGQNVNYCHLDNVLPDLNLGCINDTQPFAFVFGLNGLAFVASERQYEVWLSYRKQMKYAN